MGSSKLSSLKLCRSSCVASEGQCSLSGCFVSDCGDSRPPGDSGFNEFL